MIIEYFSEKCDMKYWNSIVVDCLRALRRTSSTDRLSIHSHRQHPVQKFLSLRSSRRFAGSLSFLYNTAYYTY